MYIGEFSRGRCEGKGKRIWAETGEIYDGKWYQGMRHGVGCWIQAHKNKKSCE